MAISSALAAQKSFFESGIHKEWYGIKGSEVICFGFLAKTITDIEMINGELYYRFWGKNPESYAYNGAYYLMREEDNRVYYMANGEYVDHVLYDFNLLKGDQINYYPITDEQDVSLKYQVDSVDNVLMLNGEYRKRWLLSVLNTTVIHPANIEWIEGIGCTKGSIIPAAFYTALGKPELLCYFENGVKIYSNPLLGNCTKTDIGENNGIEKIVIYPNPVTDYCYIQNSSSAPIKQVRLLSIDGKMLKLFEGDISEINCGDLNNGLYLLEIINKDQGKRYFKLIKQ